jgi:hypothetical protein
MVWVTFWAIFSQPHLKSMYFDGWGTYIHVTFMYLIQMWKLLALLIYTSRILRLNIFSHDLLLNNQIRKKEFAQIIFLRMVPPQHDSMCRRFASRFLSRVTRLGVILFAMIWVLFERKLNLWTTLSTPPHQSESPRKHIEQIFSKNLITTLSILSVDDWKYFLNYITNV